MRRSRIPLSRMSSRCSSTSAHTGTSNRSGLGLRRIGDIEVTQLLRASPADILLLQERTKAWGVANFESWAVLLRALTHPSMSNWAERKMQLRKRSLGPQAIELLGDRVVGVCVSKQAWEWMRGGKEGAGIGLEQWALKYGASSIVGALTGNRGMAMVAKEMGMEELMRWEKAIPPMNHRGRIDVDGMDVATGLGINREVNALAACFEAVSAAVYLDGGMEGAERFVEGNLLIGAERVVRENKASREYELEVVKEVSNWMDIPLWDLWMWGRIGGREEVMRGLLEKVEVRVVDLYEVDGDKDASPVHYAGVLIRKKGADREITEGDFVSVSSHFSVEMARNAALIQARESLRGKREVGAGKSGRGRVVKQMESRTENGNKKGVLNVELSIDGSRWRLDGDYKNLGMLLRGIDVIGKEKFEQVERMRGEEIRELIETMGNERSEKEEARKRDAVRIQAQRHRGVAASIDLGSGAVCIDAVGECLERGKRVHDGCKLLQRHAVLHTSQDAEHIASSIRQTVECISEASRRSQLSDVRSLSCIGKHTFRLWSAQRSMQDVSQDRSEIIEASVGRLGKSGEIEKVLYGGMGLSGVDGVTRANSGYFALGICANEVGVATALQWLSGAEVVAEEIGQRIHVRGGGAELEREGEGKRFRVEMQNNGTE